MRLHKDQAKNFGLIAIAGTHLRARLVQFSLKKAFGGVGVDIVKKLRANCAQMKIAINALINRLLLIRNQSTGIMIKMMPILEMLLNLPELNIGSTARVVMI